MGSGTFDGQSPADPKRQGSIRLPPKASEALREIQARLQAGGPLPVARASANRYAVLLCLRFLRTTEPSDWPTMDELITEVEETAR